MTYDAHFSLRKTPVDQPIPGKTMVKNTDGGGFVFTIDDMKRLERFLILGNEGGTYYATEKALTIENAQCAVRLFASEDSGLRAIQLILDVSAAGRAPKNDPALFALAIATASPVLTVRQLAWRVLELVARTGMHLFTFTQYRQACGGWGPLARKGIGSWYLNKSPDALAFQALKYQQRDGWSHRDVLRLAHVFDDRDDDAAALKNAVLSAIVHPEGGVVDVYQGKGEARKIYEHRELRSINDLIAAKLLPSIYEGVQLAKVAKTAKEVVAVIDTYGLQREMIPTEWHAEPAVMAALFVKQPMTAMIRNLGNLSKAGLLAPMSEISKEVCARLRDDERLAKARIHPLSVLLALRTYSAGHGRRGKGEWTVVPQVVDALEDAFELSFKFAEPTNRRWTIGVDVSSSMTSEIGDSGVTSCEMAALLALIVARKEEQYFIGGFSHEFKDLKITSRDSFQSATRKAQDANFGSTRISLPMEHALKHKIPTDCFLIATDNEVNRGGHPSQALTEYREKTGIPARLIVAAFTATSFDVGDPNDAGTLSVAGMDANVPSVIADFARGG